MTVLYAGPSLRAARAAPMRRGLKFAAMPRAMGTFIAARAAPMRRGLKLTVKLVVPVALGVAARAAPMRRGLK